MRTTNANDLPEKYTSRGRTISKSRSHPNMFILDDGDGKFTVINTGDEVMRQMNPPDQKMVVRDVQTGRLSGPLLTNPPAININKLKPSKHYPKNQLRGLADIR
jgi:hypothetical protein